MNLDNWSNRSQLYKVVLFPNYLIYKTYRWTIQWARTKYALYALGGIAFAESSFFPVPPDVLLIPIAVSNPKKWWLYAGIASVFSVLGAVLGYFIGYALFETVGEPIVDFYHLSEYMTIVGEKYNSNAFLSIFTAAFTPIPFKVFTIAGGIFHISILDLIIGAIMGRSARFFAIALAIKFFGKRIEDTIEKYFNILSIVFMLLLIGGFLVIKFVK